MTVPSWQDCLDAGMATREAAEARGVTVSAAQTWEQRHGNGRRFRRVGSQGHAPTIARRARAERIAQMEADRDARLEAMAAVKKTPLHDPEIDRILNEACATVFGDRWEGPQ